VSARHGSTFFAPLYSFIASLFASDQLLTFYFTQSAMAIGMNAGKQLAFTAFALYMSGNSLHIFSIFALGMAIMSPINGLMGFANAFARYSDSNVNLIVPKVLYVLSQLGGILLVLYKFNNLGLLPNSPIDLISSLPPPIVRLSAISALNGNFAALTCVANYFSHTHLNVA
jgi:hypothetical protein